AVNSLPTVVGRAVGDPSAGISGFFQQSLDADFSFDAVMWDEPEPAMSLTAETTRARSDRPAAAGALNPPPPLPSVVVTADDEETWFDSIPPATLEDGMQNLDSTLGTQRQYSTVYLGDRRSSSSTSPSSRFDLQSHGMISPISALSSSSQETEPWNISVFNEQGSLNSSYSTTTLESYYLSPSTFPMARATSSSTSFQYISPTMSRRSSSSGSSSSWAVATPGSESNASIAFDEEPGNVKTEVPAQLPNVIPDAPRGPCSREWHLPPRTRRKRKPKARNTPKKQYRRPNNSRRRGPFKDDDKRLNTALTRKLRGCIRCRMMRIRCEPDKKNPGGDCLTCKRTHNPKAPSIRQIPCLRWIITDVSLYREQVKPCQLFSRRWQSMDIVNITDWGSTETKTITLSQIYLDAPYTVSVRQFVPVEGDMLEFKWMSGSVVRHHRVPAYALADMEEAAKTLVDFTSYYIPHYILQTVGRLDLLIWGTYYFAFHYQKKAKTPREQKLIHNCLRFWVACRKTSHPERIYSSENHGGDIVNDPGSPFYNVVPMPPIMIAQMECIMYTKVLRPISQQLLSDMKDLIMENKRENWLTTYLTLFILLHSCAMLTRRDWETARQFNLKDEYANPMSIQGMQNGMHILLAHFHYLNKGVSPFHMTYDEKALRELASAAELDKEQLEFIKFTSGLVKTPGRDTYVANIRANRDFGDHLYWVSQLYDSEWKPGPTA
ncbi:hypothetical protein AOCH_002910, partial [Aspergillus ochraceoroseus]